LQLPEPRLASLGSGLYAEIADPVGSRVWRSPSAIGVGLADGLSATPGDDIFVRRTLADGTEVLIYGVGITWDLVGEVSYGFQVYVAEDLSGFNRQLATYRRQLMFWFGVVLAGLLFVMGIALKLGLRPLQKMADEISSIENGELQFLSEGYPRELSGVARNMNMLVTSERQRISRFGTTMDDLAHSLKTPLAVLRTELSMSEPDTVNLQAQVSRMQGVIDYQLRRAAATGPRSLAPESVRLAPLVRDVSSSLRKIYQDKNIQFDFHDPDSAAYRAEKGDLYELVGNLLDNAWKWSVSIVTVSLLTLRNDKGQLVLRLTVSDDGPGVSDYDADDILSRGKRGGLRGDVPGQGIGLEVVSELVDLYSGSLSVDRSNYGGAMFAVDLPLREHDHPVAGR